MKNLINVDIKAGENTEKLIDIISVLVKTQDNNLKEECDVLVKTKCDHDTIKRFSDERTFLSMVGRNKVVLATLMACCNISNPDLSSVDDSKINGLCVAYECILNTRNKKVLTWPAVGKNLRLLKQTHNKSLLNSVSYASGGKYYSVLAIAQAEFPLLQPPAGDFVSTDDNLQVGLSFVRK